MSITAIGSLLIGQFIVVTFIGTPMGRSSTLHGILLCCFSVTAIADDGKPPATSDTPDVTETRIQALQDSAARFTIQQETDPPQQLTMREQPLFRWSNPVSGINYGIVALWADQHGRPAVLAQFFLDRRESVWIYEFQSVASSPLSMMRDGETLWQPAGAGAEMQTVPDAPAPPDGRNARSLQARRLAAQFNASVEFKLNPGDTETSHYELRLRPRPVYEYGRDADDLSYGALFTFDQGTNPEVWLLLEVHNTTSGQEWRYALAPQTAYHVQAKHNSGAVWDSPNQQQYRDRTDRPARWMRDPVVSQSP